MASLQFKNTAIRGVSACVPRQRVRTQDYPFFTPEAADKFKAISGIEERRIAKPDECTSDLFFKAGTQLLSDLGWSADSIDALIVVTQSGDFIFPNTSSLLQARFGFKTTCLAFDINQGCSGYIYGLTVASALLESGQIKRALLLVGDTLSKFTSPNDKSTTPIFGDAGTATALEYSSAPQVSRYFLFTDGNGSQAIQIPHGGSRRPVDASSLVEHEIEAGIVRNACHLALDGAEVFNFSIREAPRAIAFALKDLNIDISEIDHVILHQANQIMNETIRRKIKAEPSRVPSTLKDYGNTSSASVPLTWCAVAHARHSAEPETKGPSRLLLCGFGVGLSWGVAYLEIESCHVGEILEL